MSTGLLQEARETAVNADAAVLFLGLPDQYESEGYDRRHLSLPASQLGDWHVETGTFRIAISASSRDIRLSTSLTVASTTEITVSFHRNTTVGDLLENPLIAKFAKKFSSIFGLEDAMEDNPEMHLAMMKYMPLRALIAFGQGKYTEADLTLDLSQLNALV